MDTRSKIVSLETARTRLAEWRAAGLPVVVITGLFDPLLAAHAEQLESAAPPGVRVLAQLSEGDDPLLPLADRCELVAALRRVDLVCAGVVESPAVDLRPAHEELKRRFRSAVAAASARPA